MMNMMESVKNVAGGFLALTGELNRLLLDKIERGAELNISFLTHCTKTSIQLLRSLSGVHNIKSAQQFIADSNAVSGEVVKEAIRDVESWLYLWGDTKDQVMGVIKNQGEVDEKDKSTPPAAAS